MNDFNSNCYLTLLCCVVTREKRSFKIQRDFVFNMSENKFS